MRRLRLGQTHLYVSQLCLGGRDFGSWLDERTAREILDRALELGINFFDLADAYPVPIAVETWGRCEEIVGRWLTGRRHQIVLASKFGNHLGAKMHAKDGSRRHTIAACEASLKRLGTDHIDIYYLHHPDPNTPIDETLEALDRLVEDGKIRYAGLSNFDAERLANALGVVPEHRPTHLSAVQVRYNLLHRDPEADLFPLCRRAGLGIVPYNVLAVGMLAGRYRRESEPPSGSRFSGLEGRRYRDHYWTAESFDIVDRVAELARAEGLTCAQLAINWTASRRGVTSLVIGASSKAQLEECALGLASSPSPATVQELERLTWRYA